MNGVLSEAIRPNGTLPTCGTGYWKERIVSVCAVIRAPGFLEGLNLKFALQSRLNGYNEGVMARQLEAVYEQGILRPLEPLVLAEHQRVRLTIEEESARLSWESPVPVNERREELLWLARESGPYAGEWVALDGPSLVAHGEKLASVGAAARVAGVIEPFFARVPRDKDMPFGGW